ncbi:hypothetical protein SAMN06295879_2202 [Agreia bicolorata]|uniref:Choice-of-anchor A domain-containing protein n=1 Tax=Agreia bicolorata TaxID=110935 RepID=A0A1T4Y4T3_9MICO|nr:hypothetical protein SAMN06295879_2202 [Agreia bicolorata]
MHQQKNIRHRRKRSILGVCLTAGIVGGSLVLTSTPVLADDLDPTAGGFGGTVRNYATFAGVGLLNNAVNARANIGEGVVVVNSAGLSGYDGTGVGQFAVPGNVANDPTARAYSRSAPIGAGFTGLNLTPVNATSTSTTIQSTDSENQNFGQLNAAPLATIDALTGETATNWTDGVLNNGGIVASANTTTGNLVLVPSISAGGIPIPGVSQVLPLGQADLGQNTSVVRLVASPTATCPAGLAAESEATWRFADVQLFGGNVGVSWGGESGVGDTGTITARTTGKPGGSSLTVSQLPSMTVQVGGANGAVLQIEPGAAIELSELFAGSTVGQALSQIVDGQLTYGGTTNIVEEADGTRAAGTMNGLNADLTLLPIPIVAPSGLGSVELGFERVDVESTMQEGGLHCVDDSGANTNASASAAADSNANAAAQAAAQADASTTSSAAANGDASAAAASAANTAASSNASTDATSAADAASAASANAAAQGDNSSSTNANGSASGDVTGNAAAQSAATADASTNASGTSNAASNSNATSNSNANGSANTNASASAAADSNANAAAQAAAQADASTTSSAAANGDASAAAASAANTAASSNASTDATSAADAASAASANAAAQGDNSSSTNANGSASGDVTGNAAAQSAATADASTNASGTSNAASNSNATSNSNAASNTNAASNSNATSASNATSNANSGTVNASANAAGSSSSGTNGSLASTGVGSVWIVWSILGLIVLLAGVTMTRVGPVASRRQRLSTDKS